MTKPVGGRGKKAPYTTTVMRVPIRLESFFEEQIEQYREAVINNLYPDGDAYLESKITVVNTDLLRAKQEASKILRSKISKEKSIAKLLQVIYGLEINPEDLK